MVVLALILGILGGLCAIMGILNAVPVEELVVAEFDVTFWFSLAVILLLATIASLTARGGYQ